MEHIRTIVNLEARARAMNLTPTAAYRRAGVKVNTVSRWKLGRNSPNLVKFRDAVGRMEEFLAAEALRLAGLGPQAEHGHEEAE